MRPSQTVLATVLNYSNKQKVLKRCLCSVFQTVRYRNCRKFWSQQMLKGTNEQHHGTCINLLPKMSGRKRSPVIWTAATVHILMQRLHARVQVCPSYWTFCSFLIPLRSEKPYFDGTLLATDADVYHFVEDVRSKFVITLFKKNKINLFGCGPQMADLRRLIYVLKSYSEVTFILKR